jgi:hypothetical protein
MAAKARGSNYDTTPKPRSDAYVGLLFISLLAQIVGAVFFFLDWNQYPEAKPKAAPSIQVPAPAPGPQGGAPGVPPAGNPPAGNPPAGAPGVPPAGVPPVAK